MSSSATSEVAPSPVHTVVIALAMGVFFLSGFAALLYQVIWQRLLAMFSGADVYSATLIVAAFMTGLGLGHLAGGHVADRVSGRSALLLFGAAELSIGAFGALSPALYYDGLYQRLGAVPLGTVGTALVLFISLLWPTFFMGASLPLLARTLTDRVERAGRMIGSLYAINTFGAACGAFVATWWLLTTRGLEGSVYVGAGLNLLCAVVLLPMAALTRQSSALSTLRATPADRELDIDRDRGAAVRDVSFGPVVWCLLYGLSGLFALSVEIVWFRVLGVMMKSTAFTFGTLLALYLGGLGLGAMLGSALVPRVRRPGLTFLLLQMAIAFVTATSLTLLVESADNITWLWDYFRGYEPLHVGNGVAALGTNQETGRRFLALYFTLPALLVVPVTLLMGAAFPFLQQAVQTDAARIGRRVGQLLVANIAGSLAGCVLTGWVLLDRVGAAGTINVLMAVSTVFTWLGLRHLLQRTRRRVPAAGLVAGALAVAATGLVTASTPDATRLWSRLHGSNRPDMIVHEDGSGVSAIRRIGDQAVVFVNGVGQSHLPYGDVHTALGAVPAFIHPAPRSAAIIGLGSGDTAWAAAGRLELERIVAVEIVRPQLRSLKRLQETWPYGGLATLLSDPRIQHVFADGRTLLRRGGQRYDIIEADALRPSSAYSGNLYSDGYFALLKEQLNPGGLAATWAPTERVLKSFLSVFPHVVVLPGILVGSDAPIAVDRDEILRRAGRPEVDAYYHDGQVDIRTLLDARTTVQQVYGPDFDRSTLTDFNTDLFPRDEFDLSPRGE